MGRLHGSFHQGRTPISLPGFEHGRLYGLGLRLGSLQRCPISFNVLERLHPKVCTAAYLPIKLTLSGPRPEGTHLQKDRGLATGLTSIAMTLPLQMNLTLPHWRGGA